MPQIFEKQNQQTMPAQAGDNDYATYSPLTTVSVDLIEGASFDHIFVRSQGADSYRLSVDGTDVLTRTIPDEVPLPEVIGGNVSIIRHGWHHDLYKLPTLRQGQTVNLTFSGPDIKISDVKILKQGFAIQDKFTEIVHGKVDTDGIVHDILAGGIDFQSVSGRDRLRWRSNFSLDFTPDDPHFEVLLDYIEDHPNIVFVQEPVYPWRVYDAIFPQLSHDAPYIADSLESGNIVQFSIAESRPATLLLNPIMKFNDGDRGVLFFNPCVHLGGNGAIDDNDYATSSDGTTHTISIEVDGEPTQITHVFLKAKNVDSYSLSRRANTNFVAVETITPDQKEYRGWENSLTELSSPVSSTAIRITLDGTDTEVSEIMLLDKAGALYFNTQLLPRKTSEASVIHTGRRGETKRKAVRGAKRFRWELDVATVFEHLDATPSEDFIDWFGANPHCVVSLDEKRPWKTFPAVFMSNQFDVQLLTRLVQSHHQVAFQIAENVRKYIPFAGKLEETKPPPPGDVMATAGHQMIDVDWTIMQSYPLLSAQQIRWATTRQGLSTAAWTDIAADADEYTIMNLVNGQEYFVQLRGVNSVGPSNLSAVVSATPERIEAVPEASTDLSLTRIEGGLQATWSIPRAFPAITHQEIRWGTDQNNLPTSWTRLSATATTYRINNLDTTQTWFVQVRQVNSVGVGANSNTPSAMPLPLPLSGPSAIQRLRDQTFYVTGRAFSTFSWQAPASLGIVARGTPSLVRYEYSVNGGAWQSNGTAVRTTQIQIRNPVSIRFRAINNNPAPYNEGDIVQLTWTSISNSWI